MDEVGTAMPGSMHTPAVCIPRAQVLPWLRHNHMPGSMHLAPQVPDFCPGCGITMSVAGLWCSWSSADGSLT